METFLYGYTKNKRGQKGARRSKPAVGGYISRHNLFLQISSLENLFVSWNEFLRGKRFRPDVAAFGQHVEDNLFKLHNALRSGSWSHGAYEKFYVSDPKLRTIHKARVADRIIHHAIFRAIEPIFDRSFIFDSWSCRRNKGTHASVLRARSLLNRSSRGGSKQTWVLKCDIKKYFENVNQDILLTLIAKKIQDERTLNLLARIIKSFDRGMPLGNLTSQLFANIYLDPFDHFVKETLCAPIYLRYCDDFMLVHTSREWLVDRLGAIQNYLQTNLKLKLHPNKITIRPFHWGVDWLGYVLFPHCIILRHKTRKRMWKKVGQKVNDYLHGQCEYESVHSVLMSYKGILDHSCNGDDRKGLLQLLRSL